MTRDTISAFAGVTLLAMAALCPSPACRAQDRDSDVVVFPVMTRTHSDSNDPSLPESQPAPVREDAVPISGDVAAEIARQLSDADETAKLQRIYAVHEAPVLATPRAAPRLDMARPVDETATLDGMMDMKKSQVMRGVEDVVNRTDSVKTSRRAAKTPAKGSTHIDAQRLMPESPTHMRRIDPDPR